MKYAICQLQGHEEIVKPSDKLLVDYLNLEVGEIIKPEVLLARDEELMIGTPTLDFPLELQVTRKLVKGKKIHVKKFKAKVRYRRHIGFRPHFTELEVVKFGKEKMTVQAEKTDRPKTDSQNKKTKKSEGKRKIKAPSKPKNIKKKKE